MRKKILFLGLITLIAGCGDDDEPSLGEDYSQFTTEEFTIDYPAGWDLLSPEEIDQSAPSETQVVFRSVLPNNGIFPIISVVKDSVTETMTTKRYARLNLEKIPSQLYNYSTVSSEDITISDQETIFTVFLGSYTQTERILEHRQIYYKSGSSGFTINAAISPDSSDELREAIDQSLRSFRFAE
jgi:hypothetical protein